MDGEPVSAQPAEVFRSKEKVIRVSGDWAVHTFFDEQGNELHSVGYPAEPLVSEEAILAVDAEYWHSQAR
jgi:hypothetical protein